MPWCDVAPSAALAGQGALGGAGGQSDRWLESGDAIPVGPGGGAAAVAQCATGRFLADTPGLSIWPERRKCRVGPVVADVSRSTLGGGRIEFVIIDIDTAPVFWWIKASFATFFSDFVFTEMSPESSRSFPGIGALRSGRTRGWHVTLQNFCGWPGGWPGGFWFLCFFPQQQNLLWGL